MDSKAESVTFGTFSLPNTLVKDNPNLFSFSIDFGHSDIKVAHITKDSSDMTGIKQVSFDKSRRQDALEYLKDKCTGKLRPGMKYYVTGVSDMVQNVKSAETALDVHLETSSIYVAMVKAFVYMTKVLPTEFLTFPPNQEMRKSAGATAKAVADCSVDWNLSDRCAMKLCWNDVCAQFPSDPSVRFPLLLCHVGSNHFIFKVESDGRFRVLDFYTICGKTFQGLAQILLNAESYEEILSLAAEGNAKELDERMCDLGGSEDDDTYGSVNLMTTKMFSFGFAAKDKGKGKFKSEDIAAALVSMIANSVAQDAFNTSLMEKVSQVYFVGDIPASSELFRNEIEKEFFEKSHANIKGHIANCLFVKDAGQLPVLGAILQGLGLV